MCPVGTSRCCWDTYFLFQKHPDEQVPYATRQWINIAHWKPATSNKKWNIYIYTCGAISVFYVRSFKTIIPSRELTSPGKVRKIIDSKKISGDSRGGKCDVSFGEVKNHLYITSLVFLLLGTTRLDSPQQALSLCESVKGSSELTQSELGTHRDRRGGPWWFVVTAIFRGAQNGTLEKIGIWNDLLILIVRTS